MIRRTFVMALFLALGATAHAETPASVGIPEGGERGHRLHFNLGASFNYGVGGISALGGELRPTAYLPVWNTRRATGSFDFGLILGYQNEPDFFFPSPGASYTNHRINVLGTVGHTFHLGMRRRTSLGFFIFGGLTHWITQAEVNDVRYNIQGRDQYGRSIFNAGGSVKFAYRFSRYVGFHLEATAPFQFKSSYVATIGWVGVGLTFYLR